MGVALSAAQRWSILFVAYVVLLPCLCRSARMLLSVVTVDAGSHDSSEAACIGRTIGCAAHSRIYCLGSNSTCWLFIGVTGPIACDIRAITPEPARQEA